ncbi:MAG: hypothetical protein LBU58_05400, partial [Clostridiales bacterium]|nr:hypothetical protein [Clostridiales bacterium]
MLDAVLLPKAFYQSMSVSRRTFFCCACAVGLFNIGYPFLFVNYKALFVNRPTQALFYNAALTAALILVTGVV